MVQAKTMVFFFIYWMTMFVSCISMVNPDNPDLTAEKRGNSSICWTKRIVNRVSDLQKLKGCRVIEGSLQILFILDVNNEAWRPYTFPDLVEITEFLFVYRVHGLRSLGQLFPNLAVIRGITLVGHYALGIYDARDLETVGLHNLVTIMRGNVRIEDNPNLCHVEEENGIDGINWSAITEGEVAENYIKGNNKNLCGPCNTTCTTRHCWSPTRCQKECYCGNRSCMADNQCCHKNCVGGCTRPNDPNACVACRHVSLHGHCSEECTNGFYKYKGYRCLTEHECVSMKGHKLFEPGNGKNECLSECPVGYQAYQESYAGGKNVPKCKECKENCNKSCAGQFINTIEKAYSIQGCTDIEGPLIISISGEQNITLRLKESLRFIRRVRDYVRVFISHTLMSLEFLSSLQTIEGQNLYMDKYALYVHENENLRDIWDWETHGNLTISQKNATVLFHSNPRLCYKHIEKLLKHVNRIPDKSEDPSLTMKLSNGNKIACTIMNQRMNLYPSEYRGVIKMQWQTASVTDDYRMLSGYFIYYKATEKNVTYLAERDACYDDWTKEYVALDSTSETIKTYLKDLAPDTRYAVYVETDTVTEVGGAKARSNISYERTSPFNPGTPKNLKVVPKTESITVSWSPPTHANGVIDHYVVSVKMLPGKIPKQCPENLWPRELASLSTTTEAPTTQGEEGDVEENPNHRKGCCVCPVEVRKQQMRNEIYLKDAFFTLAYKAYIPPRLEPDTHKDSASMNNRNFDTFSTKYYSDDELMSAVKPHPSDYMHPDTVDIIYSPEGYVRELNMSTPKHTVNIEKLKHFTRYLVVVAACHKPRMFTEGEKTQEKVLCSLEEAQETTITREISGANEITDLELDTSDTHPDDDTRLLRWQPPLNPNGEILAYFVDVHPKSATDSLCIDAETFEANNQTYRLNVSQWPTGDYQISIRPYTHPRTSSSEAYGSLILIKKEGMQAASHSISKWIIAVLILLLILAFIAGWLLYKTATRKYPEEIVDDDCKTDVKDSIEIKIRSCIDADHIIPRASIHLERILGKGEFGVVYYGTNDTNANPIAAKVVTDVLARDDILCEAQLMLDLKCYHLVKAYGVAAEPPQVYLVMEYMAGGDLLNHLRSLDRRDNDIFTALTVDQVCAMACQVADGMAYLAHHKIVHRDLAARNCLIDDNGNIKISDFGMSRKTVRDYYRKRNTKRFPVRWLPPEYLTNYTFTSQSDVWSYGVVLWEILSGGAKPYNHINEEGNVWDYVAKGKTLQSELPNNTPPFLAKVAISCWQTDPLKRPYFPIIISKLFPNTSPWFNQHFRMVSFYHTAAGQEYKNETMMLMAQEVESDSDAIYPPNKAMSSSHSVSGNSFAQQPPPLPSRCIKGIRQPRRSSPQDYDAKRPASISLASPLSETELQTYPISESSPSRWHDLFASERTLNNKGKDFMLQNHQSSLDKHTHKEPQEVRSPTPASVGHLFHKSQSNLMQASKQTKPNKYVDTPTNSMIVNIDKRGAICTSLSSLRNSDKSECEVGLKSLLGMRSESVPNYGKNC